MRQDGPSVWSVDTKSVSDAGMRPLCIRCSPGYPGRTLAAAPELHYPWGEATALWLIGQLRCMDGHPTEAIAYLEAAAAILRETGRTVALTATLAYLRQIRPVHRPALFVG